MLHYVSDTLLGCWSSSFQVRVVGEKKGKKKQLKWLKDVRMDLYQIESSNQDWKSGSCTFPFSLEAAFLPFHGTKEKDGQFCLPLGVVSFPPGILLDIWLMPQAITLGTVCAVLFHHTWQPASETGGRVCVVLQELALPAHRHCVPFCRLNFI